MMAYQIAQSNQMNQPGQANPLSSSSDEGMAITLISLTPRLNQSRDCSISTRIPDQHPQL